MTKITEWNIENGSENLRDKHKRSCWLGVLLVSCSCSVVSIQAGFIWKEETSTEELPLLDCTVGKSVWGIFLINDWCSRAQPLPVLTSLGTWC